jgi:transcriptional regulator with XRE-family HTH domain
MPVPSYQIDPARLNQFRTEMQLSARRLARELREKLGTHTGPWTNEAAHSATTAYQRIERTGKTSLKTALALAEILGVKVEDLQGTEPFDPVKRLRRIVAERLAKPDATRLHDEARLLCANTGYYGNVDIQKDTLDGLAEDIGARIEAAQLCGDLDELADLAVLLGMSIDDIRKPILVRGYWWVRDVRFDSGYNPGTIVGGLLPVLQVVKSFANDIKLIPERTRTIWLSRKGLRYRLEVADAGFNRRHWIEWWRCAPNGDTGLRWDAPSQWDDRYLRNELREFAFANADRVMDFDGRWVPENPRSRFLRVTIEDRIEGEGWKVSGQESINGYLDEQPADRLYQWDECGEFETLADSWLGNGLKEYLQPHLAAHVSTLWSVSGERIPVLQRDNLDSNPRRWPTPWPARRYCIELMSMTADGEAVVIPWRADRVNELSEHIRRWIRESASPGDGEPASSNDRGGAD